MRTTTANINGKGYLMCFSTRVSQLCEERSGGIQKQLDKTFKDVNQGKTTELFWLFYELLRAGARYAKLEGIENPELMTYDDLIDSVGIDDWEGLFSKVMGTVEAGSEQTVEAVPSKSEKKRGRPKKLTQNGLSGTASELD